ncbi:MAG: hypothetical protein U9P12_06290 [Verrucomicrobiota bacterium]|nr:hypothetical protein [Verrucomicrobiota bacterium]
MKKNPLVLLATVSAIVALVSMASAVRISNQRKAAETEATALREQIARMEAYVPGADATPLTAYGTESGGTNSLVALQALLAERDAELAALKASSGAPGEERRQQRESFEERMAKMKEEDPDGYAEMIQKRQERQESIRYNLAERTATFMDLDTGNMSEEELANHELLVEKMANVWALTEAFQDPEAAPDRDAMRELATEIRDVRPILAQERTVMFKQLGTDMGYEGEDAEAFATHVEDIIGATTLQMPGGRRGGGRGGQ